MAVPRRPSTERSMGCEEEASMTWKLGRVVVCMVAVALLTSTRAYPQITQGRVARTGSDWQGAVLPGVTVTATSPALIGVRTTVTQADGKYMFPAMPSGTYKLAFELEGFKKVERDNIQVVLGQTVSFDPQLQV